MLDRRPLLTFRWALAAVLIWIGGVFTPVAPGNAQLTDRCPLEQGYWKIHPEAWPRRALVLGNPNNTAHTYTQSELLTLLKLPAQGTASIILATQLIAAKLNVFNGTNPTPIASTLIQGDSLFSTFSGKLPYGVRTNTALGKSMTTTASILENYNANQLPNSCGTDNVPPLANAGPDQTVFVGDTVTLNGSASSDADGDPLTFNWSFVSRPSGSAAVLSDPQAVKPTFVVDRPGSYTISLIVNDGKVDSAADTVIISTQNSRPVANAGPDQTTFVQQTVILDGSKSSDFDGDPLTYQWSFLSRPPGSTATLQNPSSVNPTFVVDKFGDYVVQLIVNDGFVDSVADTVKVSTLNSPPVAKAGANQTTFVTDTVVLDGSGSTDVDGNALTYSWSFVSRPTGSTSTLQNPNSVNPSFVIDKFGDYVVQLIVNDGTVDSSPSSITISTLNSPPVANAGPDQVVFVGDTVQLQGSGSTDVDGNQLGFAWSILSKPANSQVTLSNSAIVNPTFTVDVAGSYVVQLLVSDGIVTGAADTVTISTQNRPPVANAGPARTVALQATVQLDGSASNDPDGDALTFSWSLLSKPSGSGATLSDAHNAKPTFVADQAGSYVAQLIVSDGKLSSAPVTVAISTDDSVPIANAGPDQIVAGGSTVQLDGGSSKDPDGSQLFYAWSFTTIPPGSGATLSNPSVVNPTFLADKRGTYVGQLIVSDGTLVSAPDTVMVTATNRAPIAQDDSAITTVNTPAVINVLANDSDPDGDALTVMNVTQPANGKAVINANNTITYTPALNFVGSDSFTYTISDGQGGTAGATVRVTVNPIAGCPAPIITSIDPLSGPVGTEITITGINLDCGNTRNLTLNGIQLIITSLSPTQIKTFIPIGAQDGLFTLTTDGGSLTQQQLAYDVVPSQDFQLNVLPPSASVMQGLSTNYIIQLTSIGSTPFTGTALLSVSNLPTGASVFFSPAIVTGGQKATLTVTTSATTPLGSSSFQVNATGTIDAQVAAKAASAQLQVLPSGTTALAGSVLDTDGNPIQGVTIHIGSIPSNFQAVTNQAGTFLLFDPPVGTQLVFIDGQTVANIKYPTIPLNVTIVAGIVNQLPFQPFLHVQKDQNFTQIDPAKDTIVTDPELPGVTLTIPAGTQIIGWDGQPNQKVSMRVVPADRLPITPLPANVSTSTVYMFYFGKVGGGVPAQPIPFSAPNDMGLNPGDKAELWYYDESPIAGQAPNDWRMAGLGTVSGDGLTIVTDPGVGIPKFCCGAAAWNGNRGGNQSPGPTPQLGAGPSGGDPVDLSTGIFMFTATDMLLPGRIPLAITRTYRSGDVGPGPFGIGTTLPSYDDLLQQTTASVLTYVYRGNARTQFFLQADGSFMNNSVPAFRGARIIVNSNGTTTLRYRDGRSLNFSPTGLSTAIRDTNGNQVSIIRTSFARPAQIIEPTGRSLNFSWQSTGTQHALSISDPIGRTVSYEYDASNRLTKVTRPDGKTTLYTYDGLNRMTSITDARGITYLKNTYDGQSRVCQQEQADGGKYKFYYVEFEHASELDNIQLLQQGAAGGPISKPLCSFFPLFPGQSGILAATVVVDPNGHPTTYRFNGLGFVVSTTNALGQTTSIQRDPVTQQVVSTTDPIGRITQFQYDAAGNITKITDPANNVRLFEYEPTFNKLTRVTDPLGNTTTFDYDSQGNLIAITDPEQNLKAAAQRLKTIISYNTFGQPTTVTDVLGNVTTFTYDANGNLETIADPLGNTTQRTYDLISRLIAQTDPRGKATKFAYDALSRVTQITDAINGLTSFTYDANANLLTVTDARSNSVSHSYDSMDRLATRTDQLGHSDTNGYDLNGNLIATTDRKGQVSTYQYDALNRRIGGVYADGTSTQFQFDSIGRLVRAKDSVGGELLFGYDILDRLVSSQAELGTLQYTYDNTGRRTSMTAIGEPAVTYNYDANSRLRQVVKGSQVVTLDYDPANRRTKLTLPNGVSTDYAYDAASHLTELLYKNASSTLGNITYRYDATGNRSAIGGSFAQTLLPDNVFSASYDSANRQLQFGSNTMVYDLAGNLVNLTNPDGITSLTWDARQRLSAINGLGIMAGFSYDALSRRRSKQINGQLTQYLYDRYTQVWDRTNNIATTYLSGLGIDEPWSRDNSEFYLSDTLNSVVGLTIASGAINSRYNYEPFGRSVVQGNSVNSLRFTGRELDSTGLVNYRARYYSPTLQRFVNEDPFNLAVLRADRSVDTSGRSSRGLFSEILFQQTTAEFNSYSYVRNNPTRLVDPLGLLDWSNEGASQGAVSSGIGGAITGAIDGFIVGGPMGAAGGAILGGMLGLTGGYLAGGVTGNSGEVGGAGFVGGAIAGIPGGIGGIIIGGIYGMTGNVLNMSCPDDGASARLNGLLGAGAGASVRFFNGGSALAAAISGAIGNAAQGAIGATGSCTPEQGSRK